MPQCPGYVDPSSSSSSSSPSLSTSTIVAISVSLVVAIGLGVVVVMFVIRRYKQQQQGELGMKGVVYEKENSQELSSTASDNGYVCVYCIFFFVFFFAVGLSNVSFVFE